MLTWMDHYLIDEEIKNPEKVRKKIDSGKLTGIYLITLSSNQDNMLEIYAADLLKMKAQRDLCQPIVGIAKNRDNAIEMIVRILEESLQTEYAADLVNYLKNR
ncbi:MAG: hypothetical protein Q4B47_03785 [Eubacteriales bacterium]|nr:hypothetical protein [Eubacteriales bacterium]